MAAALDAASGADDAAGAPTRSGSVRNNTLPPPVVPAASSAPSGSAAARLSASRNRRLDRRWAASPSRAAGSSLRGAGDAGAAPMVVESLTCTANYRLEHEAVARENPLMGYDSAKPGAEGAIE